MTHIVIIGTLDTKNAEFMYLRDCILRMFTKLQVQVQITLADCGTNHVVNDAVSISRAQLLEFYTTTGNQVPPRSRPGAIDDTISCLSNYIRALDRKQKIHRIIGAGGTGGTSLISAAMRSAAPIGLPKLIVSTVASGYTAPIVGETDMSLMYSVVDIFGTNQLLLDILANAAGGITGMALAYEQRLAQESPQSLTAECEKAERGRTRIGITMFGVTTPCIEYVRRYLETHYNVELYVFHATGHGGMAMERLVEQGRLDAILDLTTTEICDLIAGGNMRASPERLEAALRRGIPNIISLGAADMVNFGPVDSIPPRYIQRKFHKHNPIVTLMRTSEAECAAMASFIVDKVLQFAKEPSLVEVWLPKGGFSSLSTPSRPFADPRADATLFKTLKLGFEGSHTRVVETNQEINSKAFAVAVAERLMNLVHKASQ
ncbi:UPF0261 protein [Beauveria bassiana]|nr:UPF0261 protein [Beauveria bassiana]KAH8707205.1 UPF0261 protein [Beauveria bassiana]